MLDNKKRKETRIHSGVSDAISSSAYNFLIGALLLYGFIMNAILTVVAGDFVSSINPIALLVAYFVCVIVSSIMVFGSNNPIVSFIGYNLTVIPIGALMSTFIPEYSSKHIATAIITTAGVTFLMLILGTMFKNFFSKLGVVLFVSLLVGVIAEFITMLCGYGGDIFNWLFVVIFSLYIGYDWHKAQEYPKTIDNAVDSAMDLYLDIINLFLRLLELIGKKDD